ncbi:cyclin A2;4 isoform X2 [Wolffia australiana]
MRRENTVNSAYGVIPARITRSRAAVNQATGSVLPPKPSVKNNLNTLKRTANDENAQAYCPKVNRAKRRAVLGDLSNFCGVGLKRTGNTEPKKIPKSQAGRPSGREFSRVRPTKTDQKVHVAQNATEAATSAEEDGCDTREKESASLMGFVMGQCSQESCIDSADENKAPEELQRCSPKREFIDLDRDHKNPQMCTVYAVDIYLNLRAAELLRRPDCDFMETRQRDITQGMRAILVDWLVEVSEEYKLVPDTLYLTVSIIDRFLSDNFIERQKLQLLGITSMLIASKYEEICAPRVEELCIMTDNTYTRNDVLRMESEVLSHLNFHLSVPTVKTFLRRFLRAAQASYEAPSLSLEFLANYLAELTLVDYAFLRFLPSLIAAAAVFLARWTLDESSPPWTPTLEHYTRYRFSDLKAAALELQELQVNAKNSPLHAIRQKYSQIKFKSVAAVTPRSSLPALFR